MVLGGRAQWHEKDKIRYLFFNYEFAGRKKWLKSAVNSYADCFALGQTNNNAFHDHVI